MKANAYYLQGANDFKLITAYKNHYAIARAAKYAMSDSWQAKAYAAGLNAVGYEYRQLIGSYGPLKAMNDAVWCVTGIDVHKTLRESPSIGVRAMQAATDAQIAKDTAACTERTRLLILAQREATKGAQDMRKIDYEEARGVYRANSAAGHDRAMDMVTTCCGEVIAQQFKKTLINL